MVAGTLVVALFSFNCKFLGEKTLDFALYMTRTLTYPFLSGCPGPDQQ